MSTSTTAPEQTKSDQFGEMINSGVTELQAGRYDEAIEIFKNAAALAPASAVPHFLIGSALASKGDYANAEAGFLSAVLLAPRFSIARYQLGLLQYSTDRAALALVIWQPLLEVANPTPEEQALSLFVQGYAALSQSDFGSALACFKEGVRINTGNPALSGDVQNIIARVEQFLAGNSAAQPEKVSSQEAAPKAKPNGSDDDKAHILLNNYNQMDRKQ
jgi:tetratricopeptide (TPR) repeat protein